MSPGTLVARASESLNDTIHVAKRTPCTVRRHDRIRSHWALFATQDVEKYSEVISPLIEEGAQLPTVDQARRFIVHAILSSQGRSEGAGAADNRPYLQTVKMYIRTFFAVWDHYGVHAPAEYQDQVFKYLDLEHCHQALSCTAKDDIPESRFEDHVDARILCRELWHDRVGLFHTNRMRLQIHYLMLLSALSEDRPGKMVEIQCFPCLKGGLLYSDHQVKIWPNKDDPAHPHVAVVVNIRGHRYHGYHWSNEWTGFAVLSPNLAAPAMCPVMSFLALAFLDDAFADVKTPEEVVHHPTRGHVLRYKPHIETRPVAREEELGSRQKCQGEA